jgi:hypothetical protein
VGEGEWVGAWRSSACGEGACVCGEGVRALEHRGLRLGEERWLRAAASSGITSGQVVSDYVVRSEW